MSVLSVSVILVSTHKRVNSVPTFSLLTQAELAPGLALLGVIDEKFIEVKDIYEPIGDGSQ